MPNLYKLQLALKNTSVRILLGLLLALGVGAATYFSKNVPQYPRPLVRSQDIASINSISGQRARL
jgi:cell division protease FtsH